MAVCIIFMQETINAQQNIKSYPWQKDSYFQVYLKNKKSFTGRFVSENANKYHLMISDSSQIIVHGSDIKKVVKIKSATFKNGKLRTENQYAHKYLFGPSAFNLNKYDIVLNNTLFFYNSIEYGISDHLSAGTGISLFPYIVDDYGPYINMFKLKAGGWKLANKIYGGLSGFYSIVDEGYYESNATPRSPDTHLSLGGLMTFGTRDNNFTLGLNGYKFKGWHYYYDNFNYITEYKSTTFMTISLSGLLRISKHFYLISENWIVNSDAFGNKYSFGLRYAPNKLLIEMALVRNVYGYDDGYGNYDLYPLLTTSYKF
jgi:hypothetical protein